ncbi:MAG: hypothetical protein LPD71_14845, partial [Shewanella sp.]|nr:hypothetical protein [Shewanella sp.]
RVNREMVDTHDLNSPIHQLHLRGMIEEHVQRTGSEHARMILSDLENWLDCFVLVKPKNVALADLLKHEQGGQLLSGQGGVIRNE